jgi:hypothetical protein
MTTADLVNESGRPAPAQADESGHAPLFNENEVNDLRGQWQRIQGAFVDEPRSTVGQADELVARTMKRLAEIFSSERSQLEAEWSRGDEVSTEDLRQAMRRYRSFFDRLLTV